MKPQAMLEELEKAAKELSARVSYESLGVTVGIGGLCRVKGEYRIIVDKRSSPRERVSALAKAISSLDHAELSLTKKVREVVDFYSLSAARLSSNSGRARAAS